MSKFELKLPKMGESVAEATITSWLKGIGDKIEIDEAVLEIATDNQIKEIEKNFTFLATIGSTAPFIGLFGTVWGIMNSFRGLAGANQATLAAVAPGISEALIATAIGLFAAIPALIAYNRFISESDYLLSGYESFMDEFAAVLHREIHSR